MTAPITWAEATSPILWSNIGIDWNTPALGNSATFAANVGETHTDEQGIGFNIVFGANYIMSYNGLLYVGNLKG